MSAFATRMGYPPVMTFATPDLVALEAAEEIEIETRPASGGPIHRTIVWVVTDGHDAFVRSYRGATARWYNEARSTHPVAIQVGPRRLPVRLTPAVDGDSIERASRAFERKYRDDPSTPEMLRPEILETTLRLEPA